jgi:hypothetical protein
MPSPSGLKDVDAVDFIGSDAHAVPADAWVTGDLIIKPLALCFGELFGIVEHRMREVRRQHDRRDTHRSCQRPTSSLIYASDNAETRGPQRIFMVERGHAGMNIKL